MEIQPSMRTTEANYDPTKQTVQPQRIPDKIESFAPIKKKEKTFFEKCWGWVKSVFFALFSCFFPAKKAETQNKKVSTISRDDLLRDHPPFLNIKALKSACRKMDFTWETQSHLKITDNGDGEKYQLAFEVKQDGSIFVTGRFPKYIVPQIKKQLLSDKRTFRIAPEAMVSAFYEVSSKKLRNDARILTCRNPFKPKEEKSAKLIPLNSDSGQEGFLIDGFWQFPKAAQIAIHTEAYKLHKTLFFYATDKQANDSPFIVDKWRDGLYKIT